MKCLVIISTILLLGCTKEPAPSTPYALIKIKDKESDNILADVTGKWSLNNGELFLNAEGENGELFSVHLQHLEGTGTIQPVSISSIAYSDGFEFYPSEVSKGSITVNTCNSNSVDCSFNITLADARNNTLELEGRFGVRNP